METANSADLTDFEGVIGGGTYESLRGKLQGIDNRNRLTYPRVMPGLIGSDLRADRERASRTSRTGSPRRCNHRRNGIGTKGRKDHQEMMVIDRKSIPAE